MPNETTHSNKIWLKIGDNFCLKQTAPLPRWRGYQCSTSALSKCSRHDSLLADQKREGVMSSMYDETNYIRYSIIIKKKRKEEI